MRNKLLVAAVCVAAAGQQVMAAPPSLTYTRSTVNGMTVLDFSLLNNGNDNVMASYAVSVGFSVLNGGSFNQLRATGEAQSSPANGVKTYSQAYGVEIDEGNALVRMTDTYVYDVIPSTYNTTTRDFGTYGFSSEIPGVNPFGGAGIAGTVFSAGTQSRFSFSYGTPALNPGGSPPSLGFNNNVPVAHLVLASGTSFTYTGIIARQGVNYAISGGDPFEGFPRVTLAAGGTATATVAGNGVSYVPTVVQTFASPAVQGTTTFAFAGTNAGVTLIALDLNLGTASLSAALGALPSNLSVYTGGNSPFSSAYDVVLVANTTGSGPFTFSFSLGAAATLNAIAVVCRSRGGWARWGLRGWRRFGVGGGFEPGSARVGRWALGGVGAGEVGVWVYAFLFGVVGVVVMGIVGFV